MFHLDLKRTEIAIAAGRLDEAWSILDSSSQRQHRDGQRLVDQLIKALVQRGNQHLDENRVDDAWHDADAAARLGGRQIDVSRLLGKIKTKREDDRQHLIAQKPNKHTMANPESSARRIIRPAHANLCSAEPSVLHVDGLGSLLILDSDAVSIGTASARTPHDIALQTEGDGATLWLLREGEDYFVKSDKTFLVNGRSTACRLLSGNDTISVGKRGRLRFCKPVAASGSATLEVTGAKLVRREIRKIALMADSLLFGLVGCHFAASVGESPVIMRPCVRSAGTDGYWLHRQGSFDRQHLVVGSGGRGTSVHFSDCSFTLTHFHTSQPVV